MFSCFGFMILLGSYQLWRLHWVVSRQRCRGEGGIARWTPKHTSQDTEGLKACTDPTREETRARSVLWNVSSIYWKGKADGLFSLDLNIFSEDVVDLNKHTTVWAHIINKQTPRRTSLRLFKHSRVISGKDKNALTHCTYGHAPAL